MTLKDWKKITDASDLILYVNRYANIHISIINMYRWQPDKKIARHRNKWMVRIVITNERILRIKKFKTKSAALAYAKSYMRKH